MKTVALRPFLVVTLALFVEASAPAAHPQMPAGRSVAPKVTDFAHLPLSFEAHQAKDNGPTAYLARGRGYSLWLAGTQAVLAIQPREPGQDTGSSSRARAAVLRMRLVGGNPCPTAVVTEGQPGKVHYLLGNDPDQWRTNVPTFAKVKYCGVYPGIDLVFYGTEGRLEFDFIVAPGVDPGQIGLEFEGAGAVALDGHGNLVLQTTVGRVMYHAPVLYQADAGRRQRITGGFGLESTGAVSTLDPIGPPSGTSFSRSVQARTITRVRFRVGEFDHSKPLIIDPVLVYSSYLGGSANENVPTRGPGQTFPSMSGGIAVDAAGDVYVAGTTASVDLNTTAVFGERGVDPNSNQFASIQGDAFVAKFHHDQTNPLEPHLQLVHLTVFGGTGDDVARGVAVGSFGHASVVGSTTSTNFPLRGGLPLDPRLSTNDELNRGGGFLVTLSGDGAGLLYSTHLNANPQAVAVTPSEETYVTGWTSVGQVVTNSVTGEIDRAHSFPIVSAFQAWPGGIDATATNQGRLPDAFISKFTPAGALAFSSYLGGAEDDRALAIALDRDGNAYLTGWTNSRRPTDWSFNFDPRFPVANAFQTNLVEARGNFRDAFVTKVSAGGGLIYSTYLGGTRADEGYAVAVDHEGAAYVTGVTTSTDFPIKDALQSTRQNSGAAPFVTKLTRDGSRLAYSTYLGGELRESMFSFGSGIAVDPLGHAYVVGVLRGVAFPGSIPLGGTEPRSVVLFDGGRDDADVFLLKFGRRGTNLLFSTYFGGTAQDYGKGLVLDRNGDLHFTGTTFSTNFPLLAAYQTNLNLMPPAPGQPHGEQFTAGDAFVAKIEVECEDPSLDQDNDGLPDCWELKGVDINGDRKIDLDLRAVGASPLHRDLFLEIDYLEATGGPFPHSHEPSREALEDVIQSFRNAPIENPDGRRGIELHIDFAAMESVPEIERITFPGPGTAAGTFQAVKLGVSNAPADGHLGSASERGSSNAKAIREARLRIFRYCLFGHAVTGSRDFPLGDGVLGIGENPFVPFPSGDQLGDDLLVALRRPPPSSSHSCRG
jgi:hypothetical protein